MPNNNVNNKMEIDRTGLHVCSRGYRITHWLRALAITILVVTGYYMAYVFLSPMISPDPVLFMQAKIRFLHEVFGFLLIGALIFKTYLFLFDRYHGTKETDSIKQCLNLENWKAQIKYYLFLGPHPHIKGDYNPVQFAAYFLFYMIIFLICITGIVLYVHDYHEGLGAFLRPIASPFELLFGGLSNVRVIHHICMIAILVFIPLHVYMVIFNTIKDDNGSIDIIFAGNIFPKVK